MKKIKGIIGLFIILSLFLVYPAFSKQNVTYEYNETEMLNVDLKDDFTQNFLLLGIIIGVALGVIHYYMASGLLLSAISLILMFSDFYLFFSIIGLAIGVGLMGKEISQK